MLSVETWPFGASATAPALHSKANAIVDTHVATLTPTLSLNREIAQWGYGAVSRTLWPVLRKRDEARGKGGANYDAPAARPQAAGRSPKRVPRFLGTSTGPIARSSNQASLKAGIPN